MHITDIFTVKPQYYYSFEGEGFRPENFKTIWQDKDAKGFEASKPRQKF